MSTDRFGVYAHIPFCRHRCDYCAFATWTDRSTLSAAYLDACLAQAERDLRGRPTPTSIFVGGGTPSLVDPVHLARLISSFGARDDAEITVEANPDDIDVEWLSVLADAGVNRLSIGVQSLVPSVLAALGRTHDPSNVERSVDAARQVGVAVNLDVIYGAHGESMADWATTVAGVIALQPDHVSAYALTVEAGTPLAKRHDDHPDDDDQATKYELVTDRLAAAGYEWYEISNWARPGRRCAHNLTYWLGGDYLAVGCAAHGYLDGRRHWNLYTPERYISAVNGGTDHLAGSETLDADARRLERLALLVRTGAGVPLDSFDPQDLDGPLSALVQRVESVDESWGVGSDPRLVLTEAGRMLANEVAIRLV